MKRMETLKRIIILQLSFIGLLFHTAIYAYFWFEEYYPYLRYHRNFRFYFKGHVLIIAIYFILLFFFASTYGALKIGYLKSNILSTLCQYVICQYFVNIYCILRLYMI